MIHSFETILLLVTLVLAFEAAAKRLGVPLPLLLVPAGILLGFYSPFPRVGLDPDLVLHVFLPPLVYIGAATGSWGDFRKAIKPITLLAVGCVLFTAALVAAAAHVFLPGFGWPAAFVLGAIVSPPDEVAAISIARRLGIPKKLATILEGEGLVNDATALTLFRVAAAAAASTAFSVKTAAAGFLLMVAGESAWGLFVGWAMLRLRRAARDTSLEVSLSLLTPFAAYLPAEALGGSGVLAAVVAGLYVSYAQSCYVPATTRLQLFPVWEIIQFGLDGVLFLVAGLQLRGILEPLEGFGIGRLLGYGAALSALVIAARFVWVFSTTCSQRGWKTSFVVSWSGMRGAISLAAALAIPLTAAPQTPFPQRDLIIFLTFCVIVATLVVQGITLPSLIRLLGVHRDGARERAEAGHIEISARLKTAEAALAVIEERRREDAYPRGLLDRHEELYRYRVGQFHAHLDGDHEGAVQHGTNSFNAQIELISAERAVLLELRNAGAIDDAILRRIEKDLDLQEMRLRQGITEWSLYAHEDELATE